MAHLVARKRHADVLRALAVLGQRHPTLRYAIVGEGPERIALEGLAARLGVAERVDFHGQLPPAQAIEQARRCTLFVMPSTEEAFGVAYIEAMAGGVPAIGCRGEPGPEEIAAAGDGFVLVPPGDIERLTQRIDELLSDPHRLREAGQRARATVAAHFTWERCGRADAGRLRARAAVKPVLFVTGHAPAYRVGAFARLHEREDIEVALFGGRSKHGGGAFEGELPFPHRHVRPRELAALAASGRYRAVVCPTGGRVAPAATWAGARRAARPADPVGVAVGAPAQRGSRAQLPPAATPVPLGRRGRHLRPARQRLRAGARRTQRARRPAVGRQRLLERARGRGAERAARGPRRRRRSSCSWVVPPGRRGWRC